jgi:hypothetical protein
MVVFVQGLSPGLNTHSRELHAFYEIRNVDALTRFQNVVTFGRSIDDSSQESAGSVTWHSLGEAYCLAVDIFRLIW